MSNLKLYEFTENYENLMVVLEDNPEIDAEAIADALEGIQESAEEKIFNTAEFIKKLEDDVERINNRKKELDELKVRKKNQIDSIKDYLLEHMIRMEIDKVDNGTRVVRYQNNPPSLDILDMSKVPTIFKKHKTILDVDAEKLPKKWKSKLLKHEESVDKKAMLKELKDKDEKEYGSYATIKQNKSLRIK